MNRLLTVILMLIWFASSIASSKSDYNSNLDETIEIWFKKRGTRHAIAKQKVDELSSISEQLKNGHISPDSSSTRLAFDLACRYVTVNIDSAILYFKYAEQMAGHLNIGNIEALAKANHISLLVKKNVVNDRIIDMFNSIDTSAIVTTSDKKRYYYSAYRLHDIIQEYTAIDTLRASSIDARNSYRDKIIRILPETDPLRNMMQGMKYFDENKARLAIASMFMALDSCSAGSNGYASICHHLAHIYESEGNIRSAAVFAARSALAEIESGNRSANGMVKFSEMLLKLDQVQKSYDCLQDAINNTVDANDVLGVLTTTSHYYDLNLIYAEFYLTRQTHILILIAIVVMLTIIDMSIRHWGYLCRRKKDVPVTVPVQPAEQPHSTNSEFNPGIWLSGCLDLYTAYIDNIDSFHRNVRRQIATGNMADFIKQLKSNKSIGHNAERFAESFDQAFLQLYPNFVDELNSRLLPDKKLALTVPGQLTNEIRVYAFMRMGIDDSEKIARLLGVSVNTVYTYRNKMRLRAIDRDELMEFIRNGRLSGSTTEQNGH